MNARSGRTNGMVCWLVWKGGGLTHGVLHGCLGGGSVATGGGGVQYFNPPGCPKETGIGVGVDICR